MKYVLQEQCRKSIGRFEKRVLNKTPWAPRSILMSEGFAFCAVADLFGIDVILESGIYNGRSTQMWTNYFSSDIPIIAIERRKFRESAINHLKPYKNIELIKGDGPTVIDKFILKFADKKIGIFMDGPKDLEALEFAKKILPLSNVIVVAIHDMSMTKGRFQRDNLLGKKGELYYQEGRIEFDKWELGQFLTDEKWFVDEYSWLDKDESQFDEKQKTTWYPYKYIFSDRPDRELKSYGPTIGFAFNER